jgi:NAD-dependent dihydropyrimidine dehydrogenase PreA subunit
MHPNIPRAMVTWHPTINSDACTGDRACIDFCKNGVFGWDEQQKHPFVQNPLACVLGCDSCAQICPTEAITFPSKEELRAQIKTLRAIIQAESGNCPAGR